MQVALPVVGNVRDGPHRRAARDRIGGSLPALFLVRLLLSRLVGGVRSGPGSPEIELAASTISSMAPVSYVTTPSTTGSSTTNERAQSVLPRGSAVAPNAPEYPCTLRPNRGSPIAKRDSSVPTIFSSAVPQPTPKGRRALRRDITELCDAYNRSVYPIA